MKYVDEFRDQRTSQTLAKRIGERAQELDDRGVIRIMEVCGTHTMSIARNAIKSILPANIELVSGPGCPVCVTDPGYIDAAIDLADKGAILVTFGDMLKTPGSESSLAECRAEGGRIEIAYSPTTALQLARDNPNSEVVFLAIGFETTIAPETSLVRLAAAAGLQNLSLLTAFKVVPPVLEALCQDPGIGIDAFLCPAHVSAIIGSQAYSPLAEQYGIPCVIAGFEPLDILLGIDGILKQLVENRPGVDNQYSRIVKPEGNRKALELMAKYLEPADVVWRGLGSLPGSGLRLRPEYEYYDAERRLGAKIEPGSEPDGCLCGEVVKGKARPPDCQLFGNLCTPDSPVGPCMVSQEGSCAASYKYSLTA